MRSEKFSHSSLITDYNKPRPKRAKHIWVPHSLGAIKKRNVSKERWEALHIDERIEIERSLTNALDGLATTSSTIRESLLDDYDCAEDQLLFLSPSIDTDHYYPRQCSDSHRI